MKLTHYFSLLLIIVFSACQPEKSSTISDLIPTLEELSGKWVSYDTVDMDPSVRNFWGQALANRDLVSLSWFASAPYSGGYHTGTLKVNGVVPMTSEFRWQPYQALRKSKIKGIKILSSTRMIPEQNIIMWKINLKNESPHMQEVNLELDMIGFISKYGGDWQWWYPYPKMDGQTTKRDDEVENVRKHIGKTGSSESIVTELIDGRPVTKKSASDWPNEEEILKCSKYRTKISANQILIYDNETDAISGFALANTPHELIQYNSGGRAKWHLILNAGESTTLRYLMTYGDDENTLESDMKHFISDFDLQFEKVKDTWNDKWHQLFTPGNDLISGCFPILETDDSISRKVYYTGPLTMLYLMNFNLPEHQKVFLTGGPRWGASITFFWDITEWSTLWAVVDPEMMKEHLSAWIKIDPSRYYGKDNFGGKGVGNGYSANYWALFQLIRSYLTITKDYDFLNQIINDKKVLDHLVNYATNWKKISVYGQPGCNNDIYKLADFGDDEWNLLECVPTYKHIVPSFNAGYIWMMRETAELLKMHGRTDEATSMKEEANEMFDRLLKLYAGKGVWYSLYPNNKKVEVRHCLDFMFLGRYLVNDIPLDIKEEMMNFLYRELMTDHWMRAQSLLDIAAANSDRADHGPLGAFDGWPAGTMDASTQLGYPDKALDFYHAIEPVTYEGIWSQAHELWGPDKKTPRAKVRIAGRGWHNRESSSGIAMSQVMLKCFFGFYPQINGKAITHPENWQFDGTLHHVLYGGEYYRIFYRNGKPVMEKE